MKASSMEFGVEPKMNILLIYANLNERLELFISLGESK